MEYKQCIHTFFVQSKIIRIFICNINIKLVRLYTLSYL